MNGARGREGDADAVARLRAVMTREQTEDMLRQRDEYNWYCSTARTSGLRMDFR